MFQPDFITTLLLLLAFGLAAYKISFLGKKSIGYFSLLQFIYLIIIPSTIFVSLNSHLLSVIERPYNSVIFIPDKLILNFILLAQLYTYGGIAIHAVTKMLWASMVEEESSVYKINSYFHLKFSHNLIYGGAVALALLIPLLEINHTPPDKNYSLVVSILMGVLIGLSFAMAIYWYKPYGKQKFSKWSDLKTVFMLTWIGLITFSLAIRRVRPDIKEYQLFIPMLSGFIIITLFNVLFVLRKLKNGGFRIYFHFGKKEQRILEVKNQPFPLHNKQSPSK